MPCWHRWVDIQGSTDRSSMAASLACLDIIGCTSSVALVLAMRCTWSLSAQRWQICVTNFHIYFQPHQTMQQFMWQPNMLQVAKFLDAGIKRLPDG